MTVGKIDMTFPSPTIGAGIAAQQPYETLMTVRIDNAISLEVVTIHFHIQHPSLSVPL